MSRGVTTDAIACAATRARRLADELARWSSYAMAALLLAGAATLWCRHWAMALRQPLDWPGMLLAGALAAGTGAAARTFFRWAAPDGAARRAGGAFERFVSLCLAAWGAALSLSDAHAGGLMLFWTILAGEELWAWQNALGLDRWLARSRTGPQTPEVCETPEVSAGKLASSPQVLCEADVLQQFVRSRQPGGGELLSGWMRVPLSPQQRSAAVHLAFCPPFARTPTITVARQDGPAARIKEAQVLPFGARLDLKLLQPTDTPVSVLLEIVVRAEPPADAAAPPGHPKSQFQHLPH